MQNMAHKATDPGTRPAEVSSTRRPRELPKYTDLCRCTACGEHFNSTAAFDKHRIGAYDLSAPGYGRRCRTPDEMRAAGMGRTADGQWWTSDARQRASWTLAKRGGDAHAPEPSKGEAGQDGAVPAVRP